LTAARKKPRKPQKKAKSSGKKYGILINEKK
jgi:hypothetical protein